MPQDVAGIRKKLLIKLTVIVLALIVVAVLVLLGVDVKDLSQRGLEAMQQVGPVAFFAGMAVLPALGVPCLVFLLPAVSLFGERFGTPLVVLFAVLAEAVNMALTYALARGALRPLLEKLVARLGYKLPQVETGDQADLVVIMRVTPGIPFCVQNYLLGLARIPFGKFLVISSLLSLPQAVAFLLFGDALLHGKGKLVFYTILLLVAVTTILHLVRKHYEGRKARL